MWRGRGVRQRRRARGGRRGALAARPARGGDGGAEKTPATPHPQPAAPVAPHPPACACSRAARRRVAAASGTQLLSRSRRRLACAQHGLLRWQERPRLLAKRRRWIRRLSLRRLLRRCGRGRGRSSLACTCACASALDVSTRPPGAEGWGETCRGKGSQRGAAVERASEKGAGRGAPCRPSCASRVRTHR